MPLNWAKDSIQRTPKCLIKKTQENASGIERPVGCFPDFWRRSWDGDAHVSRRKNYYKISTNDDDE